MSESKSNPRVAPQFAVVRSALIHVMASAKTPLATNDIAKALGVNRSYVIRLQDLKLRPRTAAERKIVKLANENEAALKKLGFGFIFNGDLLTTLAGGERMSLPPESRGGRPRKGEVSRAVREKAKKAAPKAKKEAKAPAKKARDSKAKKESKPPQPTPKASAPKAPTKSAKAPLPRPKADVKPPKPAKASKAASARKPKAAKSTQPPLPLASEPAQESKPSLDANALVDDLMGAKAAE